MSGSAGWTETGGRDRSGVVEVWTMRGAWLALALCATLMAGCGWLGGDDAEDGELYLAPYSPSGMDELGRGSLIYSIDAVIPDRGPLAGGTQVMLLGSFPGFAGAASIYTVFFDANPANYDILFNPVITANAIYVR